MEKGLALLAGKRLNGGKLLEQDLLLQVRALAETVGTGQPWSLKTAVEIAPGAPFEPEALFDGQSKSAYPGAERGGVQLMLHTIQVGAAAVTIINDGDWTEAMTFGELYGSVARSEWPAEYLEVYDQPIAVPCFCYHIATPKGSIVVDVGMGQWHQSRPGVEIRRTPGLIAGLARLGIKSGAITDVIITHAHMDHYAGIVKDEGKGFEPAFPNARCYLGAPDWTEHPHRGKPESRIARTVACLEERGLLTLVRGRYDLYDGVSILPAPGESPGHSVVRVASEGAALYLVADLFHHPVEVDYPSLIPPGRPREVMMASRQALLPEMLAEGALILASHIPEVGRLTGAPDGPVRWMAEQRLA